MMREGPVLLPELETVIIARLWRLHPHHRGHWKRSAANAARGQTLLKGRSAGQLAGRAFDLACCPSVGVGAGVLELPEPGAFSTQAALGPYCPCPRPPTSLTRCPPTSTKHPRTFGAISWAPFVRRSAPDCNATAFFSRSLTTLRAVLCSASFGHVGL
jgi:hypothetical protein